MSEKNIFKPPQGEKNHHRYKTPLENKLEGPISSLGDFISNQITTSILLVFSAIVAMAWVTFGSPESYLAVQQFKLGIKVGEFLPTLSLKHFVNDFLMAIFFFLLGLEVKREFIAGELSDKSVRSTVVFAALGGMIMPALLYVYLSPNQYDMQGWGVPIATDTAFALGALALLKSRLPPSLFSFIAALAVIDDIGAITVLAVFYTQLPDPFYILLAATSLVTLTLMNAAGVRKFLPYLLIGILTWILIEKSNLHGTVAGILVALTIPARPKTGPRKFTKKVEQLTEDLRTKELNQETTIVEDPKKQKIIQKVESLAVSSSSPIWRLQHVVEPYVFIMILPIFAFLNAGIPISIDNIARAFEHQITVNIFTSLLVGKFVGISLMVYLVCRLKLGTLPQGMRFGHAVGLSMLAGIGFTMSIFIAEMGFGDEQVMVFAKTGIFAASIVAAIAGFLFLLFYSKSITHSNDIK